MVATKYEHGIIQKFETNKGFGFIQPDSGEARLFFHIKQSNLSKIEIKQNLAVSYNKEISERNGKLQAVNVSKQSVTNHEEIKVINSGKIFIAFCSFFPCSLTVFHRGRQ